jgi:hypothetical protein
VVRGSPRIRQGDTKTTGSEITGSFSRDINPRVTAGISVAFADRDQTHRPARTTFSAMERCDLQHVHHSGEDRDAGQQSASPSFQSKTSSDKPIFTSNTNVTYWLGSTIFNLVLERGFSETFAQGRKFRRGGNLGRQRLRDIPLLAAADGFVRAGYRENDFTGQGGGQAGRKEEIATGLSVSRTSSFAGSPPPSTTPIRRARTSNEQHLLGKSVRAALNAGFY